MTHSQTPPGEKDTNSTHKFPSVQLSYNFGSYSLFTANYKTFHTHFRFAVNAYMATNDIYLMIITVYKSIKCTK